MKVSVNPNKQKTSQTGQNPSGQTKRPQFNYWRFSTFLLLIILIIISVWFSLNTYNRIFSDLQPLNQTNQIVLTGVIRTSGLSGEEKQKLGLTTVNYQITDFGNYPKAYKEGQILGYYLLSRVMNDQLLGKCVRVTGIVPPEWKNRSESDSYNRLALNLTNIEKIDNSSCHPYSQTSPAADNLQEKLVLRGTVTHAIRPAPDIGYDYQIQLSEPFLDKFSSAGSPQNVSLVDVVPGTDSIWVELENSINNEISVEGNMVWGYAESRSFKIISIKGSGNTEESEIISLVTKFEKHIQDRNVNGIVSLFTPAYTAEEIASYQSLIGFDPDVGVPRLFNNVTSNFIVTNWKIARRDYPDNNELITKDNGKYYVTVQETRKSWCNADPCAGTYSFENTSPYIFEIVNVNSQWMVDKYYLMNQGNTRNNNGGPKYEALMF